MKVVSNSTPKEELDKIDPELIAKIQAARSKGGSARLGVPYGWTVKEWRKFWAKSVNTVRPRIKKMEDQGLFGPPVDPSNELEVVKRKATKKAMITAATLLDVSNSDATKLQAARLILEFTMSKPVSHVNTTVQKAEDFLLSINGPAPSPPPPEIDNSLPEIIDGEVEEIIEYDFTNPVK